MTATTTSIGDTNMHNGAMIKSYTGILCFDPLGGLAGRLLLSESKHSRETKKTHEYKRALAVLQLEAGISLDMLGITEKHAQRIRWNFHKIGAGAFIDKRHNNSKVLLTGAQRDEVLVMLGTTTPNDWGYSNSAFWSTRILGSVIEERYGVVYSSRTSYYVLFKKASFSFHLPGKQYEKADAEVVAKWKKEQYQRLEPLC